MPDMDGFQLLETLQENYPSLPVYMISAYNNYEYIEKSKNKGAAMFFPKPLDFSYLTKTIDSKFQLV